ncbi:hypothetical protein PBAL39_09111 [Pedobacter sp. BAL39]|nr:hypothetical protein PBAL39_09111 [Pedobacter sp. BAL39]
MEEENTKNKAKRLVIAAVILTGVAIYTLGAYLNSFS